MDSSCVFVLLLFVLRSHFGSSHVGSSNVGSSRSGPSAPQPTGGLAPSVRWLAVGTHLECRPILRGPLSGTRLECPRIALLWHQALAQLARALGEDKSPPPLRNAPTVASGATSIV